MAIADAEPKKGEVDVTSTGSSSGSKEMKKPRGPIKYSSLKDFSFSVSDVWDDRNICTFIECCHANLEDLKTHNGSEENKVWEKIAKSGLERSGSVNCFNVNYCLELAKCLKSFVSKNEKKMMDNEIFKKLYNNVVDLLPYFAPVSPSRHRSRSKSVENSKSEKIELLPNIKGDHMTIPPFGTSSQSTLAVRLVAKILNQYKVEEFVKTSSRNAIFKEVTDGVEKEFGVHVNPKLFLEGYKRSVVSFVRHADPLERGKVFLEQVDTLLPFFDHIAPRSTKASEFMGNLKQTEVEETRVKELTVENVDSKKRKEQEEENNENPSSPKSKRRLNSGGESVADSGDIPLTTNTTIPLRTYLKKRTISDSASRAKKSRFDEDSDDSCSGDVPGSATRDFLLDDWNSSGNEGVIEQPPEKEPEPAPIETEIPPVEAPVKKKRGRKPKNSAAPTPVLKPDPPAKKVMPSRRGNRSMKDGQVDIPQEEVPKKDSAESLTVSPSKELIPIVRVIPNPLRKVDPPEEKELEVSSKLKSNNRKKDSSLFLVPGETIRIDRRESEDSEIEDVPLMGTNIRVHTIRGKVEQSTSRSIKGNMNPVVLLDKISPDSYLPSPSSSARTKPIPKSIQTRGKRTEPAVAAPTTVTTIERRRPGRPPKYPRPSPLRTRTVPARREITPAAPTSSVEVARQPVATSIRPLDRSVIVRELETRPSTNHSRHLMPMSPPSTSLAETFSSRSDVAPPEWFERFVMETRRHEMWKVHQLMKMQQELLDSECKKRGVLEKILSALRP